MNNYVCELVSWIPSESFESEPAQTFPVYEGPRQGTHSSAHTGTTDFPAMLSSPFASPLATDATMPSALVGTAPSAPVATAAVQLQALATSVFLPKELDSALGSLSRALQKRSCTIDKLALFGALRPLITETMSRQWDLPGANQPQRVLKDGITKAEKLLASATTLKLDIVSRWVDELRARRSEIATRQRREALQLTDDQIVRSEFKCPITLEKMVDPVTASDGHNYERAAIERVLQLTGLSPITRQEITSIAPNHGLKNMIESYEQDILALIEARQTQVAKQLIKGTKRAGELGASTRGSDAKTTALMQPTRCASVPNAALSGLKKRKRSGRCQEADSDKN